VLPVIIQQIFIDNHCLLILILDFYHKTTKDKKQKKDYEDPQGIKTGKSKKNFIGTTVGPTDISVVTYCFKATVHCCHAVSKSPVTEPQAFNFSAVDLVASFQADLAAGIANRPERSLEMQSFWL
jgi:hypothetical protein